MPDPTLDTRALKEAAERAANANAKRLVQPHNWLASQRWHDLTWEMHNKCDPTTILALLSRLETAEAHIEKLAGIIQTLREAHDRGQENWEAEHKRANDLAAERDRLREALGKAQAVVTAVQTWAGDRDGGMDVPADAELHKALWTYDGDRLDPCPECDGECGEPCAPCTVAAAHAMLDEWISQWHAKRDASEEQARKALT